MEMKINLIEYFEETAEACPEHTAVIDGERRISFEELRAKSRAVGEHIVRRCGCKNRPVALYLPKSVESVCADIGITYSGNM